MSINAALEKIKPVKAEPEANPLPTTTSITARERLLASAASPEHVRKIIATAAEVAPRDRAVAIAEILEDFPDRALRRKLMDHLVQQFRSA
jgi:hypothetical protein